MATGLRRRRCTAPTAGWLRRRRGQSRDRYCYVLPPPALDIPQDGRRLNAKLTVAILLGIFADRGRTDDRAANPVGRRREAGESSASRWRPPWRSLLRPSLWLRRRRTSDADAAITQAWDAGGGATGPLGPKDGDVYAVGAGFGQNFAGGKIFFTPDTGAHIMHGRDPRQVPVTRRTRRRRPRLPHHRRGRRQGARTAGTPRSARPTTRSSSGRRTPVRTWCAAPSTRRGTSSADRRASSACRPRTRCIAATVTSQTFTGGQLSWDAKTKAFTTTPPELADQLAGLAVPGDATSAIDAARRAAGGPLGPLGAAEGPPSKIGADGLVQNFAGGKIFYSPATGANVVTGPGPGQVRERRRPAGRPGVPDEQRGRRRSGPDESDRRRSPPRISRSSSGRPTSAPSSCAAR